MVARAGESGEEPRETSGLKSLLEGRPEEEAARLREGIAILELGMAPPFLHLDELLWFAGHVRSRLATEAPAEEVDRRLVEHLGAVVSPGLIERVKARIEREAGRVGDTERDLYRALGRALEAGPSIFFLACARCSDEIPALVREPLTERVEGIFDERPFGEALAAYEEALRDIEEDEAAGRVHQVREMAGVDPPDR